MKRSICILLSVLLILCSFVGCSSKSNDTSEESTVENSEKSNSTDIETEAPTEKGEYYAVDLINMTLDEILEIMGNEFETEYCGAHLIWYTSGGLCIYNDSKLPGFAFFIDEAEGDLSKLINEETEKPDYVYSEDNYKKIQDNALKAIKKKIQSGTYKSFKFMGVFDNAKYDDKISANMTYIELSDVIGSYETGAVAGSSVMRQPIQYSDGRKTPAATAYYEYSEDLDACIYRADDGMDYHDIEKAKTINPKIHGIAVFPDESKTSNDSNSETELAAWKKVYINYLNKEENQYITDYSFNLADIDNNGIPELFCTPFAVAGTQMFWIKDNEVQQRVLGYGEVRYITSENLVYCNYMNHGIYNDNVYTFKDQELSSVFTGTILPEENGFENPGWFIGDSQTSVSESEYNEALNNAFDKSKSETLDGSTVAESGTIIQTINEY